MLTACKRLGCLAQMLITAADLRDVPIFLPSLIAAIQAAALAVPKSR